jgi:hypothetical protein
MVTNVTVFAAQRHQDPTTAAHDVVKQGAVLTKILLYVCLVAEVVDLALIPFMPDGRPATWWHWCVLVVMVLFIAALLQVVRVFLDNFLRTVGEAAARERGHGPPAGNRW